MGVPEQEYTSYVPAQIYNLYLNKKKHSEAELRDIYKVNRLYS